MLANAVVQSTYLLADTPHSRASPLPQLRGVVSDELLATILAGGCGQVLFERALKMRLISKPSLQRHIGNQLPATQTLAGKLDALIDQKRMRCHAVMLLERADQILR